MYYIAQNNRVFREYLKKNRIEPKPYQFIDSVEKLKGLDVNEKNLTIIGDPMMPYSFWVCLWDYLQRGKK
jgi:hypothetical protein